MLSKAKFITRLLFALGVIPQVTASSACDDAAKIIFLSELYRYDMPEMLLAVKQDTPVSQSNKKILDAILRLGGQGEFVKILEGNAVTGEFQVFKEGVKLTSIGNQPFLPERLQHVFQNRGDHLFDIVLTSQISLDSIFHAFHQFSDRARGLILIQANPKLDVSVAYLFHSQYVEDLFTNQQAFVKLIPIYDPYIYSIAQIPKKNRTPKQNRILEESRALIGIFLDMRAAERVLTPSGLLYALKNVYKPRQLIINIANIHAAMSTAAIKNMKLAYLIPKVNLGGSNILQNLAILPKVLLYIGRGVTISVAKSLALALVYIAPVSGSIYYLCVILLD